MSYSTQQLRKTCTTHTHKPRIGQSISIDAPNLSLCFSLQSQPIRTNIPFNYTGRCVPKAQRGPLQNQVEAFQRYKIHFKKPLSLPHGNHLLSSIIARPRTTRFSGACICHLISYFQKTILFTFFLVYTKKSLQTTLSFFWIDLEDLSGIYLNKSLQTSNICVVF